MERRQTGGGERQEVRGELSLQHSSLSLCIVLHCAAQYESLDSIMEDDYDEATASMPLSFCL